MTNQQFLQQFGHFIEAPNGIQKLRELILQLAVQGKLVPQDGHDESASALLDRIKKHQKKLIKEKKAKKAKELPEISADEFPHSIPKSWKWVRLAEIGQIVGGGTPKSGEASYWSDNGISWLTPADLYGYTERYIEKGRRDISEEGLANSSAQLMPAGTVLFSSRAPIGYVAIAGKPLATNQGFKSCVPYIDGLSEYLYFFLKHAAKGIDAAASGTTFKEVSGAKVSLIPVSLPPLPEQHRIVAKVDDLMALCDRLEAERNAREATHQRLIRAVHHPLTEASTTSGIEQHTAWRRIRDNFADLYTTLESVQALRQTILQLAVQGKLVAQDPSDEPAFNLIENIKKERERRVTKRVSKQNKFIRGDIQDEDIPFELPSSWEWCRFGTLVDFRSELVQPNEFLDLVQIAPDSIEKGTGKLLIRRSVKESGIKGPNNRFYKGQILYSKIRPSLSKAVIAPCDGLCSADMYPLEALIDKHFLLKVILSEVFLEQVRILENRIKMPKLNVDSLSNILVAVPPENEQHLIVTKVDEMMTLCDQLEANIRAKSDTAARYAEAIIQQIAAA
jgi:type I restriction enzyme S subunit